VNKLDKREKPSIGYYITDYENEIREICAFLEEEGMNYKLVNDFEIQYSSDSLAIYIFFERNGETVSIDYSIGKGTNKNDDKWKADRFSIDWTIVEYKNGKLRQSYIPKNLSKLDKIRGCLRFYQDYKDVLLDKSCAKKLKKKYDRLLI
jgi:hypothetical protein